MSWKQLTHFKNIPIEARVSMAYAVCSILQNCLQFVTLPLFARILTTEQYGQYTIYTSWSAILVIFITLNLPYGSFSTAMVKFEEKRDRYIASAEGICLLLTVCFLALYLPFQKRWNILFELPTGLVLVMLGEMLANAGILFWSGKKRFEYRYKSVIAVTLLNSVLGPVAAYILVVGSTERGYAR
ncbi:MAG: oligosaccharide flippase family protein, partial [Lachnospiraceae bacterium]|nr:oligosaccharide flippase family protein [Lachnospiraceae bacterium]